VALLEDKERERYWGPSGPLRGTLLQPRVLKWKISSRQQALELESRPLRMSIRIFLASNQLRLWVCDLRLFVDGSTECALGV
jgi:hypothetical protein